MTRSCPARSPTRRSSTVRCGTGDQQQGWLRPKAGQGVEQHFGPQAERGALEPWTLA